MRPARVAGGVVKLGSAIGDICCACAPGPAANSAAQANMMVRLTLLIEAVYLFPLKPNLHYIATMAQITSNPLAWRTTKAPSLAEFEVMAGEVFARLPERFRDLAADVVIRVDDFPTNDVLNEIGAETEFDLLGLFHGVGLPFRSESAPVQMPNMIWLYRRPILDYWAEHDETLGAIIKYVLVHEIGHHFGLSDADMAAIEQTAEQSKGAL